MAPETASITVVCPRRAAHGAVIVRLVHGAPAGPTERGLERKPTRGRRKPTRGRPRADISIPPIPHPHTRTHLDARTHAHTHTNARLRTIAQRAQRHTPRRQRGGAHACAQIRPARVCGWAHGRYRRGGSAAESAVETAAESLPIAHTRARTHLRDRPQSADAVAHRDPQRQPCVAQLPILSRRIRVRRSTHKHTRMHSYVSIDRPIHRTHTRGCAGACASRGKHGAGRGRRGPWSMCLLDARPCAAVPSSATRPPGRTK